MGKPFYEFCHPDDWQQVKDHLTEVFDKQEEFHDEVNTMIRKDGKKVFLNNEVTYMPQDHWTRGMGSYATHKVDYSNDLCRDEALRFMDENQSKPYFLYMPVTMPHNNGEAPDGEQFESPTLEPYLDNLTNGTMTFEGSLIAEGLTTFKRDQAIEVLKEAAEVFRQALKLYGDGRIEDACQVLSKASALWTQATWKEFLETDVIKSAQPAAYRPVDGQ
jgi:hypothetical protein